MFFLALKRAVGLLFSNVDLTVVAIRFDLFEVVIMRVAISRATAPAAEEKPVCRSIRRLAGKEEARCGVPSRLLVPILGGGNAELRRLCRRDSRLLVPVLGDGDVGLRRRCRRREQGFQLVVARLAYL